jgi:hypothetical protein
VVAGGPQPNCTERLACASSPHIYRLGLLLRFDLSPGIDVQPWKILDGKTKSLMACQITDKFNPAMRICAVPKAQTGEGTETDRFPSWVSVKGLSCDGAVA